jgi:hypothetical protein
LSNLFQTKQTGKKVKNLTHFDDLTEEILRIICHYLSPAHVLSAFFKYDKRLFSCISEYRQNIDLSKRSYSDFKYFLVILAKNSLQPSTITVSNARMPAQFETFFKMCFLSTNFSFNDVHHLSMLELTEGNFSQINLCLNKFKSLQSLHIVQSTSDKTQSSMNYSINEKFRQPIFNSFDRLTELELTTNDGIILDKQIHPNKYLKKLIISLQTISDLYILFDGLTPNLTVLHVTICQSNVYKRSSLPSFWPIQFMSQLMEFQLIINENIPFNFDQLQSNVMPLIQLDKFTLVVKQWISDNQQFIEGHQVEMLIQQYLPQLHYLYCSIKTINDINMQVIYFHRRIEMLLKYFFKTFATLSERWPMKCRSDIYKHLYTVPWAFQQLHTSMLADDDTSVCPAVQSLIVDKVCTNLLHCFPNIDTLTILPDCNLSQDNYIGFRRLRHLTMNNINIVPSSVIRHIHTLTLSQIDELLNHPNIYSNIKHLILKNNPIGSSAIITALVEHFPDLHSLEIQLQSNDDYYDNLDMLLNNKHLPYLSLLKTNWIDNRTYGSSINLWLTDKTIFRWRSTPFCGHRDGDNLTICL